jgi:amidase
MHAQGYAVWAAIRGDAACTMLLEMNGAGIGHEGLYVTSLMQAVGAWRDKRDSLADTVKIAAILSKYTVEKYGGRYYGKAQNIRRRLRAAYDAHLATYDLLLMPTVPMKATPHPAPDAGPQEITRRSWEATRNTCPFNVTGHPAISIPCGMADDRPIGLMLVGKHFDEATIYRAARVFEAFGDWKAS